MANAFDLLTHLPLLPTAFLLDIKAKLTLKI